jgi:hypothetical protein
MLSFASLLSFSELVKSFRAHFEKRLDMHWLVVSILQHTPKARKSSNQMCYAVQIPRKNTSGLEPSRMHGSDLMDTLLSAMVHSSIYS